MPCTSIPYAVARVKVLEDKLINQERIDRMVSSTTSERAFKVLVDMGYGNMETRKYRDFEKLIDKEMMQAYALVSSITPDEELSDVFILKYDYHNAKAYLKMRISNTDVVEAISDAGKYDIQELKEMVFQQDIIGLPDHLAKAIAKVFNELHLKPSPQKIDMMMDKAYMQYAVDVANKKKNKFLCEYLITKIDLGNVLMMLRVRSMQSDFDQLNQALIAGGKISFDLIKKAYHTNDDLMPILFNYNPYSIKLLRNIEIAINEKTIWKFGKYMDDTLMEIIKKYKDDIFKIEPVIGYLLAKENESRVIRLIMTGKLNNMTEDVIRERLRDIYV